VETPGCGKVKRLFKKKPTLLNPDACSEAPEPVSCEQCCAGRAYKWNPRTGGCLCAVKDEGDGGGGGGPAQQQCHVPSPEDLAKAQEYCKQQGKELKPSCGN